MSNNSIYQNLINKLKNTKNIEIIISIIIITIIISIFISTLQKPAVNTANNNKKTNTVVSSNNQDTNSMESKLSNILSVIQGAGKVKVLITYETGTENVYAMDSSTKKSESSSESNGSKQASNTDDESSKPFVIQQSNGTQPVIVKEKYPEVKGVVVIAEGAANIKVKMNLIDAVRTALDIPVDRINVFQMDNKK